MDKFYYFRLKTIHQVPSTCKDDWQPVVDWLDENVGDYEIVPDRRGWYFGAKVLIVDQNSALNFYMAWSVDVVEHRAVSRTAN